MCAPHTHTHRHTGSHFEHLGPSCAGTGTFKEEGLGVSLSHPILLELCKQTQANSTLWLAGMEQPLLHVPNATEGVTLPGIPL